jgi:hypothetical protein
MAHDIYHSFLVCTWGDLAVLASIVPTKVSPNKDIPFFFLDFSVFVHFRDPFRL